MDGHRIAQGRRLASLAGLAALMLGLAPGAAAEDAAGPRQLLREAGDLAVGALEDAGAAAQDASRAAGPLAQEAIAAGAALATGAVDAGAAAATGALADGGAAASDAVGAAAGAADDAGNLGEEAARDAGAAAQIAGAYLQRRIASVPAYDAPVILGAWAAAQQTPGGLAPRAFLAVAATPGLPGDPAVDYDVEGDVNVGPAGDAYVGFAAAAAGATQAWAGEAAADTAATAAALAGVLLG